MDKLFRIDIKGTDYKGYHKFTFGVRANSYKPTVIEFLLPFHNTSHTF